MKKKDLPLEGSAFSRPFPLPWFGAFRLSGKAIFLVQRSKPPADYFSAMAARGRARGGVAVLLLVTLGLLAPSFLTPQVAAWKCCKRFLLLGGFNCLDVPGS